MTEKEKELLNNLFDSLDRLFDRDSQVYDVYCLMVATNIAFKSLGTSVNLTEYTNSLKSVIQSEISEEDKRDQALFITDPLRSILDDLLSQRI